MVDKPAGLTSFRTALRTARRFGLRKAGHTGTLDSNVTGLLVVGLGEATKGLSLLARLDKEYEGTMRVCGSPSLAELRAAAARFVGTITQMPPERSAVNRVLRQRRVYCFDILRLSPISGGDAVAAEFRTATEAGTYVRTLLADLGRMMGVEIAMSSLRRTRVGPFCLAEAKRLEELTPADLLPLQEVLRRVNVPPVEIGPEEEIRVRRGLAIAARSAGEVATECETVSLVGRAGRVVALARREGNLWRPFRVLAP